MLDAVQNKLFIDGECVDSDARARIPVLNPHDNSLITEVAGRGRPTSTAPWTQRASISAMARPAAADRGRLPPARMHRRAASVAKL
jgi:hypothetical protein